MITIKPFELHAKLAAGDASSPQILDVRTPVERREVHIPETSFLPLDSLNADDVRQMTGGGQIYLLCRSGARAAKAWEKLYKEGASDPIVIEGGIVAWEDAGFPVVKAGSVISMERQVRIAAGLLVLTGSVSGFAFHPYGHLLSAMVGAGLVVAGLTNTCAMARLLSKLPWNQVPKNSILAR